MRDLALTEWVLFVAGEAPGVEKSLPRITQTVAWGDPGSPTPFVVVAVPAPSVAGMAARGALGSPSTSTTTATGATL